MDEATEILAEPETGSPAIAAETEAIELLLQSQADQPARAAAAAARRPAAAASGTTQDSALALLGGGVNEKEVREDRGVSQATGDSGPVAARGVPRRPRRVLQPARTQPEPEGGRAITSLPPTEPPVAGGEVADQDARTRGAS